MDDERSEYSDNGAALVLAAQAGDEQARDTLVAVYLPLVYNIVGRALDGHLDVDDVVQETMLRAVRALPSLRDPEAFRSWLVAIAMNQVRRRWAERRDAPFQGLDEAHGLVDPAADFVGLTILGLGLSGQRREVAEATRWLDASDRHLLSLWWMEVGGELGRDELAAALEVPATHAAVRVQRMKHQLDISRSVVRALSAAPRCEELSSVIKSWDDVPSPFWRKRIFRHVRECEICLGYEDELIPAEKLLTRLPLLPIPVHLGHTALPEPSALVRPAMGRGNAPTLSHRRVPQAKTARAGLHGLRAMQAVVGMAIVSGAAASVMLTTASGDDAEARRRPGTATSTSAAVSTTPTSATSSAAATPTPEQQLVRLVNAQRSKHGCGPLRIDPRLHSAAQQHSADMAEHGYFEHDTPSGVDPGTRISQAGYVWSTWAENLDTGPDAAGIVSDWMGDASHRDNLLNCRYTVTGVGVAKSPKGVLWTQDFASPG